MQVAFRSASDVGLSVRWSTTLVKNEICQLLLSELRFYTNIHHPQRLGLMMPWYLWFLVKCPNNNLLKTSLLILGYNNLLGINEYTRTNRYITLVITMTEYLLN